MKWVKLKLFFFLLVVGFSPLFSLSSEEEARLQELSKEELIEIVMILDNSLTEIEKEMISQEKIWNDKELLMNQREIDLNEREILISKEKTRQEEREASFIMREQLLEESWEIQAEMVKAKFWDGFLWGGLSGIVVGGVGGGLVGSQFQ